MNDKSIVKAQQRLNVFSEYHHSKGLLHSHATSFSVSEVLSGPSSPVISLKNYYSFGPSLRSLGVRFWERAGRSQTTSNHETLVRVKLRTRATWQDFCPKLPLDVHDRHWIYFRWPTDHWTEMPFGRSRDGYPSCKALETGLVILTRNV